MSYIDAIEVQTTLVCLIATIIKAYRKLPAHHLNSLDLVAQAPSEQRLSNLQPKARGLRTHPVFGY